MSLLGRDGFHFFNQRGMEKFKQQTTNYKKQIKFNSQSSIFKQPVFINSCLEFWKLKFGNYPPAVGQVWNLAFGI